MAEPVLAPLGRSETRALTQWLHDAAQWGIDPDDIGSIAAVYDDYLQSVQTQPAEQRSDPTPVLTMVAMALGEFLVRRTDLQWQVVTDDLGRDLAVTGSDGAYLFLIDPIAEAWENQRSGWLVDFADHLLRTMAPR